MTGPWYKLIDMQEIKGLVGVFGSFMKPQKIPSLLHEMENKRKQLSNLHIGKKRRECVKKKVKYIKKKKEGSINCQRSYRIEKKKDFPLKKKVFLT